MIKVRSGKRIIFGLSDMNMQKLRDGKPIKVDMKDLKLAGMDPNDLTLVIFNGRTEESMTNEMLDLLGKKN